MGLFEFLLDKVGPWGWWILGLVLLGLEILVPGTFFLWFGVGALVVGTLALFVGLGWQVQVVIWLVLSIAALAIGRRYTRLWDTTPDPTLNDRLGRFIGRVFTLTEPIVESAGRLSIEDTIWRITGPELPAGTKVRVTAANGPVLVVEPVRD